MFELKCNTNIPEDFRTPQEQILKNKEDIEKLTEDVAKIDTTAINQIKADVVVIKSDITTIKSDITTIKSDVTTLQTNTNKLTTNYNSQYHLVECYEQILATDDFNEETLTVTLENEMFSLTDSIVSWSPKGNRDNIDAISDCQLILLEQTEDNKIVFSVSKLPISNLNIIITVYLIGTATDESESD